MNICDARILFVGDDAAMSSFVEGAFRRAGITRIDICTNGKNAPQAVSALRPDLLPIDVHMQPVDGIEFVQRLQKHPSVVFRPIWHLKPRLFALGSVANPRDTYGYRCGLRLAQSKNPSVLNVPSRAQHYTRLGS